jgi:Cytotoxic translational repressor of toxin-antitoxin stability system
VKYVVLLESRAEKELKSLPKEVLQRVDIKLQALSLNPRPRWTAKLKGKESEGWRLRIGDYRLLYQIDDKENVVRIYRIKHRREVYR